MNVGLLLLLESPLAGAAGAMVLVAAKARRCLPTHIPSKWVPSIRSGPAWFF